MADLRDSDEPARLRLARITAAFGDRLHRAGLPVTPERSLRLARAVALARPTEVRELYWLGRVTLLSDHGQVETYDRVFRETFRGIIDVGDVSGSALEPPPRSAAPSGDQAPGNGPQAESVEGSPQGTAATPGAAEGEDELDQPSLLAAVSQVERLNERAFSTLTEAELAIIRRLIERLAVIPPRRLARRMHRDRSGSRLDMRATLRRSYRTAADPVHLVQRSRSTKPRRVVLIADVSGSMEPYARVYLHLMRGAVIAVHAEAFAFATRLTHLSRALRVADADAAYGKVAHEAQDWSGGTRIGRSLKDFLDHYGRRGMARGAVVVIVSDGWEIGEVDTLRESMERLSRLAHHVIWVNPRKAAETYQPLVGGMAAALPYVDTFLSGHSVQAVEQVLQAIAAAQVGACHQRRQQTPTSRALNS